LRREIELEPNAWFTGPVATSLLTRTPSIDERVVAEREARRTAYAELLPRADHSRRGHHDDARRASVDQALDGEDRRVGDDVSRVDRADRVADLTFLRRADGARDDDGFEARGVADERDRQIGLADAGRDFRVAIPDAAHAQRRVRADDARDTEASLVVRGGAKGAARGGDLRVGNRFTGSSGDDLAGDRALRECGTC
jgi:hypothetical protein